MHSRGHASRRAHMHGTFRARHACLHIAFRTCTRNHAHDTHRTHATRPRAHSASHTDPQLLSRRTPAHQPRHVHRRRMRPFNHPRNLTSSPCPIGPAPRGTMLSPAAHTAGIEFSDTAQHACQHCTHGGGGAQTPGARQEVKFRGWWMFFDGH